MSLQQISSEEGSERRSDLKMEWAVSLEATFRETETAKSNAVSLNMEIATK